MISFADKLKTRSCFHAHNLSLQQEKREKNTFNRVLVNMGSALQDFSRRMLGFYDYVHTCCQCKPWHFFFSAMQMSLYLPLHFGLVKGVMATAAAREHKVGRYPYQSC